MNDWFTIDQIDDTIYIIGEYRHCEETHCYILIGEIGEKSCLELKAQGKLCHGAGTFDYGDSSVWL